MTLFTFPDYEYIGSVLRRSPGHKKGVFAVRRYANGEMHITLGTDVRGQECIVLGSITPPDVNLLSLLLLADTLKRNGARRVIALLPYCAYMRHDKIVAKESLATAWIGSLFEHSQIDHVVTFSLHSDEDRGYIPIPINSLALSDIFASIIVDRQLTDASLVAPDEGAIDRCKAVKRAAQIQSNIAHFKKRRTKAGVVLSALSSAVGPDVVIIDDMIDTGQTLLSCCKKLKTLGVKRITIMVTHGLFTGDAWTHLWDLGVDRIYCTDSLPPALLPNDSRIIVIPVAPLLQAERLCL